MSTEQKDGVIRLTKLLLKVISARKPYAIRAWTAFMFPIVVGTFLGWSSIQKLEGVLLALLAVVLYVLTCWLQKWLG